MLRWLVFLGLMAALALPTYAQEEFANEGLTDEDVTEYLAAEILPTIDGPSFWWENVRSRIAEAFTFNAERKAALHRRRLHQLDRKVQACTELGDDECLARIEEQRTNVEERAGAFLERRDELKGTLLERFTDWREHRTVRHDKLQERIKERRNDVRVKIKERHALRSNTRTRIRTDVDVNVDPE